MISLGPGQRETIKSGREQDLTTPILQTLTLLFCCAWALGWFALMALAVGPTLGYAISIVTFAIRWKRKRITKEAPPWWWIGESVTGHVVAPWYLSIIWTPYNFGWTPWLSFLWSLLCVMMMGAAGALGHVMVIRLYDPNNPSPRKAITHFGPVWPWTKEPGEVAVQPDPGPRLIRTQVESTDPRYHSGTLDLPPVREWYDFAQFVLRHPDKFSEPHAKRFLVKITLRSKKGPWFGRGFRQVRDDLFDRQWAAWVDENAKKQGIELFPEAIAAFREYCEDGPPPLQG